MTAEQTLYGLVTQHNIKPEEINQDLIDKAISVINCKCGNTLLDNGEMLIKCGCGEVLVYREPVKQICPYSGCVMPCNCAFEANQEC